MKVIEVDWIDSTGFSGWQPVDRAGYSAGEMKSIGFLIHEDKKSITISASMGIGLCDSPISIPKCAILKRRTIGVRK